jgi:hypothetical protein
MANGSDVANLSVARFRGSVFEESAGTVPFARGGRSLSSRARRGVAHWQSPAVQA